MTSPRRPDIRDVRCACGGELRKSQRICGECKRQRAARSFKLWSQKRKADPALLKENRDRARGWRNANKHRMVAQRLRRKFGMSLDDFARMLIEQSGCCAICNEQFANEARSPSVDHCHTTGRVRGLLCPHCNTAVGLLKDDWGRATAVVHYLLHQGGVLERMMRTA